jgi:hypothetical protein
MTKSIRIIPDNGILGGGASIWFPQDFFMVPDNKNACFCAGGSVRKKPIPYPDIETGNAETSHAP